jgi:hypothetical protein
MRAVLPIAMTGLVGWLVLGVVAPASAAPVTEAIDDVSYTADPADPGAGATITSYISWAPRALVIPDTVTLDGVDYTVTSIGPSAFQGADLTTVTLPDSVTSIQDSAFRSSSMSSVNIPDGVTSIGPYAFWNSQVTSVVIPEGITTIETYTFASSRLASVTIPDSVTTIADQAFSDTELTEVVIPDSVTALGDGAFGDNVLLTEVTLPAGITTIPEGAFQFDPIASIDLPDGLTTVGSGAFYGNALTELTIPDSVTEIRINAFGGNQLTAVTLGDGVTDIGVAAFADNALTSLTIPASATSIGFAAFDENPLTAVRFLGAAPVASWNQFGTNDPTITYYWRYGAPRYDDGFTTPTWAGYDTQAVAFVDFAVPAGGTAPPAQQVIVGDTATEPAHSSWAGHTFDGWFTASTGGARWDFATSAVSGDQTLFEQWSLPGAAPDGGEPDDDADAATQPADTAPATDRALATTGVSSGLAVSGAGLVILLGLLALRRAHRTASTR